MFRGTTPTITWRVNNPDIEFKDFIEIWASFKDSKGQLLTKTLTNEELIMDEDACTISYQFSQEETLKMQMGVIEAQLRVLFDSGSAYATPVKTFTLDRILKGGVIE